MQSQLPEQPCDPSGKGVLTTEKGVLVVENAASR